MKMSLNNGRAESEVMVRGAGKGDSFMQAQIAKLQQETAQSTGNVSVSGPSIQLVLLRRENMAGKQSNHQARLNSCTTESHMRDQDKQWCY